MEIPDLTPPPPSTFINSNHKYPPVPLDFQVKETPSYPWNSIKPSMVWYTHVWIFSGIAQYYKHCFQMRIIRLRISKSSLHFQMLIITSPLESKSNSMFMLYIEPCDEVMPLIIHTTWFTNHNTNS